MASQKRLSEIASNTQKKTRHLSNTLKRYALNLKNGNQEQAIINSQFFDSIVLINPSKISAEPLMVYGQQSASPILKETYLAQLDQSEFFIFTDNSKDKNAFYLLQNIQYSERLLLAKININQWEKALNVQTFLKQDQVFLINSDSPLSQQFIDYLIKKRSHQVQKVNGYYITQLQRKVSNGYQSLSIFDIKKPNLLSFIINTSGYSFGLFFNLLILFASLYLKTTMKSKVKGLELSNITLPLKAHFLEYLNATSNIDKAILSGASFDQVVETSLNAMQGLLNADVIGLTLLKTKTAPSKTIYLRAPQKKISASEKNIEASLVKMLQTMRKNTTITLNSHEYQFSAGLSNKNEEVLVCPILNKGILSGFIFAIKKRKVFNSNQVKSFKNIVQHISMALTTILNNEQLYIKEYFDPVTDLYNQHACRERLSQEFSAAIRRKTKVAVFHLKLIGHNKINKTFGYSMGDNVLKEAGNRLKLNLRQSDIIARLGGNDFIIATSDLEMVTNANRLADKVAQLFETPIQVFDNTFHLSTAIGVSIYPTDGISVDEMLNNANTAVSSAVEQGNNTFAFYEENLSANEKWRIHLEQDLRMDLNNNNNNTLFVQYQPQVDARTSQPTSAEALVRWDHPKYGRISPIEFIALAEETGLIIELGRYVRKIAFQQFMEWKKHNIGLTKISVNISSYEIQRSEFIQDLENVIALTGIQTNEIELEITESLILEVSGNVTENLKKLSEMDISIAIDDFGTGYSNLSYLGRIPFDVLKIDRSFMHGVGINENANKIMTMMIEMAHHLGKVVCVEGVETDVQYEYLKMVGCDIIQGYYISKPLSMNEYTKFSKQKIKPTMAQQVANVG